MNDKGCFLLRQQTNIRICLQPHAIRMSHTFKTLQGIFGVQEVPDGTETRKWACPTSSVLISTCLYGLSAGRRVCDAKEGIIRLSRKSDACF